MIEFRNPYHIEPPGSIREILSHPLRDNESMELALFQEHRYAFFFWAKWIRKLELEKPPCLVSLDWHQDLCFPCETEKEWLDDLDLNSDPEIAVFSWAKLAGNNDGHILCAAYLNLIGDIYVHCKQGTFESEWEDEELIDKYGNIHIIKKYKKYDKMEEDLLNSKEENVFFDIDLDFFTVENSTSNNDLRFTYVDDALVSKMLNHKRPLVQWVFERLRGFTIATEPEHCGGILKSNKYLNMISNLYFKPALLGPHCNWKWKEEY